MAADYSTAATQTHKTLQLYGWKKVPAAATPLRQPQPPTKQPDDVNQLAQLQEDQSSGACRPVTAACCLGCAVDDVSRLQQCNKQWTASAKHHYRLPIQLTDAADQTQTILAMGPVPFAIESCVMASYTALSTVIHHEALKNPLQRHKGPLQPAHGQTSEQT